MQMSPIFGSGIGRIDAERFDGIDGLEDSFERWRQEHQSELNEALPEVPARLLPGPRWRDRTAPRRR